MFSVILGCFEFCRVAWVCGFWFWGFCLGDLSSGGCGFALLGLLVFVVAFVI